MAQRISYTVRADAEAKAISAYISADSSAAQATRFVARLVRAVQRAAAFPDSGDPVTPRVRRLELTPFKYHVYYAAYPDRVEVLTIVHQHQHPDTCFGGGLDPTDDDDDDRAATTDENNDDDDA